LGRNSQQIRSDAALLFRPYDQGDSNHDGEGLHCSSKQEIQRVAIDALPDMAREALPDGPKHSFRVEVRNDKGVVIFRARLELESEWLGEID
jgi:hypothetical protein